MRALTQLKLAGTKSFRLSASQLFGYGVNAQNTDKSITDIFEAPPGWSIVQVDQSGAEALVVAYLCRPGAYRELFLRSLKPHIYVALHIFIEKFRGQHPADRYWLKSPLELQALPEWPELSKRISGSKFEYDVGKRTGHASNYKMGPNTFREQCLKESEGSLNLTLAQARFFLETYKILFPEIVEWQEEIAHEVTTTRCLRNLFGFPRRFDRLITDGYAREAISWIPQSTVGCITHRAYTQTFAYISYQRLKWRMFNNKHDSYACCVPDSEVHVAADVMSRNINQTLVGRDAAEFTMKSEIQVGKNMKKFSEDNPMGLKEYRL